jgi:hypothetical protein
MTRQQEWDGEDKGIEGDTYKKDLTFSLAASIVRMR